MTRALMIFMSLYLILLAIWLPDTEPEPKNHVTPGYVACVSLYHLDQYNQATHRQQVKIMMDSNCLPTDVITEHPVLVMNEGTTQFYKIRVFLPDDQYADLFVPAGSIK